MLNPALVHKAFHDRLLTLVVATTGSMSLGASATGFTRSVGSFIDDGFAAGMELEATGFAPSLNKTWIAGTPTALNLPILGGLPSTAASAGSRSLTVGIPEDFQSAGTQTPVTTTPATRPRLIEQFIPATSDNLTYPEVIGLLVDTGQYVLTWQALANKGVRASLLTMWKLKQHFPAGYEFVVGDDRVRIKKSYYGQPIPTANNYESSTFRIEWRAVNANVAITIP